MMNSEEVSKNGIDFKLNTLIHNRFDVEVVDANTGEIKQRAVGHNVICDQLYSYLFNNNKYFNYIFYGGGTGTPSASDTSLFSYIGGQSAGTDYTHTMDFENGVHSAKKSIQLTASTAVGQTITEVGIAYSSTQTTLCTHALLKDMSGNPTSISKTDTDVVNIYATIFIHFTPTGFSNGSIHLYYDERHPEGDGYTNDSLFRWLEGCWTQDCTSMCNVEFSSYGGSGFVSAANQGEKLKDFTLCSCSRSIDIDNKKIVLSVDRIESSSGNSGGYRTIALVSKWNYSGSSGVSSHGFPQVVFQTGGTWYPYSSISNESVGVGDGETKDFNLEFPFVHDATIKVNDVTVTDVSMDYAPNKSTDWQYYMEGLDSHSTDSNKFRCFFPICDSGRKSTKTRYFYNPMHAVGISGISLSSSSSVYASNDLNTWELVGAGTSVTISDTYKNYKYWKHEGTAERYITGVSCVSSFTGKTLHFDTAPAVGDVITADYQSDTIAKNENNVFDMTVTIQLGEYTE